MKKAEKSFKDLAFGERTWQPHSEADGYGEEGEEKQIYWMALVVEI